jgi:RNA polymerase-binding transcription factor DksA
MTTAAAPSFRAIDLDDAERDLAAVDHAVERLEQGTYGACETCGVSIAPIVAENPLRAHCDEHAVDEA